jgi:hypothetical protein
MELTLLFPALLLGPYHQKTFWNKISKTGRDSEIFEKLSRNWPISKNARNSAKQTNGKHIVFESPRLSIPSYVCLTVRLPACPSVPVSLI